MHVAANQGTTNEIDVRLKDLGVLSEILSTYDYNNQHLVTLCLQEDSWVLSQMFFMTNYNNQFPTTPSASS